MHDDKYSQPLVNIGFISNIIEPINEIKVISQSHILGLCFRYFKN